MDEAWCEAASRRLRALIWKGLSVREAAFMLSRDFCSVQAQVRKLKIADRQPRQCGAVA